MVADNNKASPRAGRQNALTIKLREVRDCRLCQENLPQLPRPVLRASHTAKILIIGQAPGRRVHESGIPWDDPSGDRLREWMQIDNNAFYDESKIAIVPMGFCFPGTGKSGDLPPRPECAPQWHESLLDLMPSVEVTLLIGSYAQKYYLQSRRKKTLTETVANWKEYEPGYIPLPHPSPRNNIWLRKNAWFEEAVLPALRRRVKRALKKTA